jgi:hypothetical protein
MHGDILPECSNLKKEVSVVVKTGKTEFKLSAPKILTV